MTNADKFKEIFGIYATELWARPEKEFLEWLNADVPDTNVGDTIRRQDAIDMFNRLADDPWNANAYTTWSKAYEYAGEMIEELPSVQPEQQWIPVTAKLPKDFIPVNVTWVNHSPESYYADIKDKPFTATAIYCDGEWYWYSSRCEDYLKEFGVSDMDYVADGIEITAWMPLPAPWEGEGDG